MHRWGGWPPGESVGPMHAPRKGRPARCAARGPAGYAPAMDEDRDCECGPRRRGEPPRPRDHARGARTGPPTTATRWAASRGRCSCAAWAAVEAAGAGPGTAVDVGFGDGTETMRLLEAGWRVTAIDSAPAAAEVLEPRVPADARDRLTIVTAPADDVDLPPFDLLYSAYVLSYLAPDAFARLWARVREPAPPGRVRRRQHLRRPPRVGRRARHDVPAARRGGGAARRARGHRARPRSRRTAARSSGPRTGTCSTSWPGGRRERADPRPTGPSRPAWSASSRSCARRWRSPSPRRSPRSCGGSWTRSVAGSRPAPRPLAEAELADAVLARLDDLDDPALTIPPPRDQRDRRDPAHEPRPGAVAARGARSPRSPARRDLRLPGAGRGHRPARAAVPGRRGAPRRAHRRRGRAGRHQQRGGAAAGGGAGGAARVRGRSRAASWWRSAAGCGSRRSWPGPARGWSRWGPRTGRAPRTSRRRWPTGGATVVLRVHPSNFAHERASRSRRTSPRSRRSPTGTAPSSSTTWDPARCWTRPRSASPTSPRRRSGWPPVPTSSCSAATSWWAGRRRG